MSNRRRQVLLNLFKLTDILIMLSAFGGATVLVFWARLCV